MELAPEVLLKETYQEIIKHPEQHNQARWYSNEYIGDVVCSTAYCFAGMAVHLAYPKAIFASGDSVYCNAEMSAASIPELAAELLGLDSDQADMLFASNNTLENIRLLLERWNVL